MGKAIPWFKTAARITKIAKWVTKGVVFVAPPVYVFGFMRWQMERAAYAAYGAVPPEKSLRVPQETRDCILRVPRGPGRAPAQFNDALRTTLTSVHDNLAAKLITLREHMAKTDELEQALDLLVAEDGVLAQLAALDRACGAILLQGRGILLDTGKVSASAQQAQIALSKLRAHSGVFLDGFETLVTDVIDGIYTHPSSYRFKAEYAYLKLGLAVIATEEEEVAGLCEATADRIAETGLVNPAVLLDPIRVQDADGQTEISETDQVFTVQVQAENLGTASVDAGQLRLSLAEGAQAAIQAPDVVSVGTLASGATATLTWTLTFTGNPATTPPLAMNVELLENGERPTSFVPNRQSAMVWPAARIQDADGDGLPLAFEEEFGLDPALDDAAADPDEDGLTNQEEFLLGTRPDEADTDCDGLSDKAESDGSRGVITDPLQADTDADGTQDGADGAPLDATSLETPDPAGEPVVALESAEIVLLGDDLMAAGITVTNAGGGELRWQAESSRPAMVATNFQPPYYGKEGSKLMVALARSMPLVDASAGLQAKQIVPTELRGERVVITVRDISGAVADQQEIGVWLGEIEEPEPDGGLDGSDGSDADGGPSPDEETIDGGELTSDMTGDTDTPAGGCACSAPGAADAGALVLLGLALTLIRRTRRPS